MTNLNTTTGEMSTEQKNQLFEEEFLPLLDSVYTFALSQLTKRDATAAEDLVQET
jgi:DNA-directed RNA polymerase specialized sigma24 family protein